MRPLMTIIFSALLLISCNEKEKAEVLPPNTYKVNVKAEGVYNGLRAHINSMNSKRQQVPVDTAMIANESATFVGKISSPGMYTLTVNGVKGNLQFILEPGVTDITVYKDSIHQSKVEGGINNQLHSAYKKEFTKKQQAIRDITREIGLARRNNEQTKYKELYNKSLEMQKELSTLAHDFIEKNPDADFSLILLETMLVGQNQDLNKFKSNLAALNDVAERSEENKNRARKIESFIAQMEAKANLDIGKIAPNFTAPDPNGKPIALNDIKGKATIIDFWASWCGPCRRENPNVVRVYNKYKDKGLEIISVSLDRPNQKQRWLDAIKKDNLTWHHVSNLQYFNDPVARMYDINSIPATFILDEEGRIVAKKLRGQALEDQIASMLN